jgi:tetratricopeptide (TPR) repeat protein
MNSSDTERERFVVPQWLPFKTTLSQRELFVPAVDSVLLDTQGSDVAFNEAWANFQASPGPFLASDLLGVAVRLGKTEAARALAEYVADKPIVGTSASKFALQILGRWKEPRIVQRAIHSQIREARQWIRRFPMDAIAWIEHARLYTIIGQKRQAARAIERGMSLAPTDRFVVRAAVRFFIHCGDWERANKIAGDAARATDDPWLISLWISTGSRLAKVPSGFRSKFITALAAPNRFHNSELIEACATHEIITGGAKKASRAFKEAWSEPPKTVITHSQWVLREKLPDLAGSTRIDFSQSSEAMAWVRLMRLEFPEAVQSAREWALEEPYSTAPYMHGTFVDTLCENYEEAEALALEGLRANPGHHGLINNLAFALVGQDRAAEAAALLEPLKPEFESNKDVALLATWGLVRMKQKAHAEGRKYYLTAIEQAKEQGDHKLTVRAVLNYLIAEISTGGAVNPDVLSSSADAILKTSDARIVATAERLQSRLNETQSLFTTDKEKTALKKFTIATNHIALELRKMIAAASAPKNPAMP